MQFLAFLEFLVFNHHSCANVSNYVSAIKTKLASLGVSTVALQDQRVTLFCKELKRNRPFKVTLKPVLSIKNLKDICQICDSMHLGYLYKAVYLLAFFSFLRISNLVPHSIAEFSKLKQLTRGDVIFAPPGAILMIKWSKLCNFVIKLKC